MSKYELKVEVKPQYMAEHSSAEQEIYSFSYAVSIKNVGSVAIQLISRTWHINDANGFHEKVKGWISTIDSTGRGV